MTIKKNIPKPNNEVAARPVDVRRARARAVNAVTKNKGHISVFCLPDTDDADSVITVVLISKAVTLKQKPIKLVKKNLSKIRRKRRHLSTKKK